MRGAASLAGAVWVTGRRLGAGLGMENVTPRHFWLPRGGCRVLGVLEARPRCWPSCVRGIGTAALAAREFRAIRDHASALMLPIAHAQVLYCCWP